MSPHRPAVRVASYLGDRALVVEERAARPPGPGEVELRVAYTGICGTDLHVFHGAMDARVRPPAVLGHEMSGTVVATGAGVDTWPIGARVTVMPLDWCGSCPACASGNSHVCHRLSFLGLDSPGSLQSRWTVPARALVEVPDALPLDVAALAEPTAVAVHDVRRAGLERGEPALVVGGGPIGLLIALVARAAGGDVRVVEISEERRELARSLGIVTIDPGPQPVPATVDEWTDGAGAAVAFEVSGSPHGLETGLHSLAVRGRMVVVGIHPTPPPVDLFRVFWRELTLVGARVYQRSDFEEAVRLLAAEEVPARALISAVEPLEHVSRAFETLETGGAMKILIDLGDGPGTDG